MTDLGIASIVLVTVFLANAPLAASRLLSPDAACYLDIGSNILAGKGFVTSYNVYLYWPSDYYPVFPYTHWVYAAFAGVVYHLLGLKTLISANILMGGINAALIYLVARMKATRVVALLAALFIGLSANMTGTSVHPWTEQMHLLCLLGIFAYYLKYERHLFAIGACLGLTCLVRSITVVNAVAMLVGIVALHGLTQKTWRQCLHMAGGFLLVFGAYQLMCFATYGAWYPQNVDISVTYIQSRLTSHLSFQKAIPAMCVPESEVSLQQMWTYGARHVRSFVKAFGCAQVMLIVVPCHCLYMLVRRRNCNHVAMFMGIQGLVVLAASTLAVLRTADSEPVRLSLVPYVMITAAGFLAINDVCFALLARRQKYAALTAGALAGLLLAFQSGSYSYVREYYLTTYPEAIKETRTMEDDAYRWIRDNTPKTAKLASTRLWSAFLAERPFVSLPPEQSLRPENMKGFVSVFQPGCVMIEGGRADIIGYFTSNRWKISYANELFVVITPET